MFCSNVCKDNHNNLIQQKIDIDTYRTPAKHVSFSDKFYQDLSAKEDFCVCCGNKAKQQQQQAKIFNKIVTGFLIFSTIIPGSFVVISSKEELPKLTSF